jgi:nucleoside-diphosphate-sugar epimerase
MKVLIIGGTGLISTRITQQLLMRGDDVTHFNRGRAAAGFGGVGLGGDVTTLVADRSDPGALDNLPLFDCVIDMIAFTSAHAHGAVRAFTGRCGQYVFCSTVDVYAHPHPHGALPYREDAPRVGLNAYARDKVECEAILEAAYAKTPAGLPVTIIRPAATYAEGAGILDSLRGRPTYLDRLRKGRPIIVHGDGQSLWCSCHADDVARAFVGACGNAQAVGAAFHVTGEEFLTWDQHHQTVARAISAPAPTLVHIPTDVLTHWLPSGHIGDAAHWTATNFQFNNIFDNRAAHETLGFRYTIRWEAGAQRLATWLDAHGRVADSDADPFDDALIAR